MEHQNREHFPRFSVHALIHRQQLRDEELPQNADESFLRRDERLVKLSSAAKHLPEHSCGLTRRFENKEPGQVPGNIPPTLIHSTPHHTPVCKANIIGKTTERTKPHYAQSRVERKHTTYTKLGTPKISAPFFGYKRSRPGLNDFHISCWAVPP